ncbi:selenocysteine lyase isoform X3 [Sciurus carolinensis]|uniref:selenocysteine lyase isoform X3 n=1 Tax=Sciurus carolinensis TaxID=30640 RepID=UPI001FB2AFB2|nr:selenocysteine lyase isoform X3 [Sciurus carolinensis]
MEAVPTPKKATRGRAVSPPGCRREKSPQERKVYMDYNATTPLEPEVIQAMTEAMWEAWGNPSSPYTAGKKAKDIISAARETLANMIGGKPQDIIFTSGGTESNNLVIHSMVKYFHENQTSRGDVVEQHSPEEGARPHFITCTVEHDSIRLPLEHLVEEQVAEVTFVPVSRVNGQAEIDDILAAVRPTTCLVTIMLANNETGVVMPVPEISQRIRALNQRRAASGLPRVLVHTDAAQALGKRRVDVEDLGVDFLTIVGHKFYGPRIGALYVRGLGKVTPLYPMLFGGGQERNFRPGTENTPMIAGLGKAAELVTENWEAYEAHMRDVRDYLEERLQAEFGRVVLAQCRMLLASVGASCHSDQGDRPSPVLLSCGIPFDVARNALRLSVGRSTTRAEVDLVVQDLKQAVAQLEGQA